MSHTEIDITENGEERRKGLLDRRFNEERRNEERMSYMKGEARKNMPRRQIDVQQLNAESEVWWSDDPLYF